MEKQIPVDSTTIASRVAAAFAASSADYIQKTLVTRNPGPEARGSTFLERLSVEALISANWRPANDPAIQSPAVGFIADIPGLLGLVELAKLDPQTPCRMELGHKGGVPFVSAVIDREYVKDEQRAVNFTTLLLGPGQGDDPEIVWTFFPGGAVAPSTMEPSEATEAVGTVAAAIQLGFGLAKIAG